MDIDLDVFSSDCLSSELDVNDNINDKVVNKEARNALERQRRIECRDALHGVKDLVPELSVIPRPSKLMILNTATQHIKALQQQERQLKKIMKEEKKRRKLLSATWEAIMDQSPDSCDQ